MTRARELRAAGWSLARIRDLVERETGRRPSLNTVSCWVQPGAADRQKASARKAGQARRMTTASFAFPGKRSAEWKLGRMQALRAAGASYSGIVAAFRVDFKEHLSEDEVRYALRDGRPPARWRPDGERRQRKCPASAEGTT